MHVIEQRVPRSPFAVFGNEDDDSGREKQPCNVCNESENNSRIFEMDCRVCGAFNRINLNHVVCMLWGGGVAWIFPSAGDKSALITRSHSLHALHFR